jgi:hypothetical protein
VIARLNVRCECGTTKGKDCKEGDWKAHAVIAPRSLVSLATPTLLFDTLISIDVLGVELLFSRTERVGVASIISKWNLAQVKCSKQDFASSDWT